MWRLLMPWLALGTQQRDRDERDTSRTRDRRSDCPACGEQMDAPGVPLPRGYQSLHCRRCKEGIEQRAADTTLRRSDRRDR